MIEFVIAALVGAVAFLIAMFRNEHKKRGEAEEKAAVAILDKITVQLAQKKEKETEIKAEAIKAETAEKVKEIEAVPEEDLPESYNQMINDFNQGK